MCLGSGSVVPTEAVASIASGDNTDHCLDCPNCGGIGVVACVNCKGEVRYGTAPPSYFEKELQKILDQLDADA